MADEYKNQHWIPEAYLKSWSDPLRKGPFVHRYDVDGKYQDYRPVGRVFSQDDLYTIWNDDGSRDVTTEKVLQKLETAFVRIRRRLEQRLPLDKEQSATLILFVAALRQRSPAMRDHWQGFLDRVTETGDAMAQSLHNTTPEQRRAMSMASQLGVNRNEASRLSLEEWREAANEPFGAWLLRHVAIEAHEMEPMSQMILEAPERASFITSDNPVVWWDPLRRPGEHGRRLGLRYSHIEITMPISPKLCVAIAHDKATGHWIVDQETVDEINARTLARCDKVFVANSADLAVDWIATG